MIIEIKTKNNEEFIDITQKINEVIKKNNKSKGAVHLFVPHTTAGLTINENADPDVKRDILKTLDKLIPIKGDYKHIEGNSHSHIKASLMGFSLIIPYKEHKLSLGTWQGVYFCEFDGPRARKLSIEFL